MKKIDSWVLGCIASLIGLLALFGAARAQDGMFQTLCLLFVGWTFFYVIRLIGNDSEQI